MPHPVPTPSRLPAEKVVRDPVHDVIPLDLRDPAERLVFDLLACTEVQRLRRIRQLGLASLAYPGADHSRYSHSLGVFHTARLLLDRLARHVTIDPHERVVVLAASLLHDLGHGPFSHVFERVSGVHHERLTARLVLDPESRVHQTLILHDKTLPETVVDFLACRGARPFLCDVVSSQLDADRLDYLLRDNLMTGSRYGGYDLRWLLQALTLDSRSRLAVVAKGLSALEGYVQARHHMYRHVYFHKVVRAAEGMVTLALARARRLALDDPAGLGLPPGPGDVLKALTGDRLSAAEFRELDDTSVMACFKIWARGRDEPLADLCRSLLDRRLYKTLDLSRTPDPDYAARLAADALGAAGGDPDFHAFRDRPAANAYDPAGGGIRVVDAAGERDFADASPVAAGLAAATGVDRLHVHPDYARVVAAALGITAGPARVAATSPPPPPPAPAGGG